MHITDDDKGQCLDGSQVASDNISMKQCDRRIGHQARHTEPQEATWVKQPNRKIFPHELPQHAHGVQALQAHLQDSCLMLYKEKQNRVPIGDTQGYYHQRQYGKKNVGPSYVSRRSGT